MINCAIILASGAGERTGLNIPKQFLKIAGKSVLEHTISVFENHKDIDAIVICVHKDYLDKTREICANAGFKKISKIIVGGLTRKESSYRAICAIDNEDCNVLIHDAVRPFLSVQIIDSCIEALKHHKAVDVAIPSADTIVKIDDNNFISEIPERALLRRGQTPQCFYLPVIKKAHELSNADCTACNVTDDCALVLRYKLSDVFVVDGDVFNRKITYPLDVAIADKLFKLKTIKIHSGNSNLLKNQVFVIFGHSRGIGFEIMNLARSFGAVVCGFSRQNGVDVSQNDLVRNALFEVYKTYGKIDCVINTAGVLNTGSLEKRSYEDISREIAINYFGAINVAKESFKYLKETKGSLLFYTSSSYTRGRADYSIYSSSKAAVVNLTQALSDEWSNFGIRVNVINPERTATPMRFENFGDEPVDSLLSPEKVAQVSLDTILSGYTGQVVDVTRND